MFRITALAKELEDIRGRRRQVGRGMNHGASGGNLSSVGMVQSCPQYGRTGPGATNKMYGEHTDNELGAGHSMRRSVFLKDGIHCAGLH